LRKLLKLLKLLGLQELLGKLGCLGLRRILLLGPRGGGISLRLRVIRGSGLWLLLVCGGGSVWLPAGLGLLPRICPLPSGIRRLLGAAVRCLLAVS
jgi:hypothetical protein